MRKPAEGTAPPDYSASRSTELDRTYIKARDEFGPCVVRRTNPKPTTLSHLDSKMGSPWIEGAASVVYRA
jgi:hypothetical protein